ncbi:hypothetical protein ABEF95_015908 [Exophiala dermatitidis]
MVQLKPVAGTDDVYLWKYLPSIPAAAVFLVLFSVVTAAHLWRMVRTRAWFCSVFAVGGICTFKFRFTTGFPFLFVFRVFQSKATNTKTLLFPVQVIGYLVRIVSYYHTDEIAPYTIQICFIVLAPVFYSASIYMVLSRLIRSVPGGERLSLIRPTSRLTKIFVWGDIVSLNVQGNGAGLTVHQDKQKLGQGIVVAGLFLQLLLFGLFVAVALVFDMRMRRRVHDNDGVGASDDHVLITATSTSTSPNSSSPWRQGLLMLYSCSALIMIRSIFRIVEYLSGVDGYLLSREWPMYAFDAGPMFAVQMIFLVWFPHKFHSRAKRADLSRPGTEDGLLLVQTRRNRMQK